MATGQLVFLETLLVDRHTCPLAHRQQDQHVRAEQNENSFLPNLSQTEASLRSIRGPEGPILALQISPWYNADILA